LVRVLPAAGGGPGRADEPGDQSGDQREREGRPPAAPQPPSRPVSHHPPRSHCRAAGGAAPRRLATPARCGWPTHPAAGGAGGGDQLPVPPARAWSTGWNAFGINGLCCRTEARITAWRASVPPTLMKAWFRVRSFRVPTTFWYVSEAAVSRLWASVTTPISS